MGNARMNRTRMNKANHDRTNTLQKGLKALDRQMLSYIVPPNMFPVHGFPGFCLPRVRNAEMLKEPMPEVELEDVLPRELPRLRASALTGGKQNYTRVTITSERSYTITGLKNVYHLENDVLHDSTHLQT